MADFKIVISDPKTGHSKQIDVKEPDSKRLIGLKIGDSVKGELIGLAGYEFQITGGSDYAGFPMRSDVPGAARKQIFTTKSVGVRQPEKGQKIKKSVAGNTIHAKTVQINMKITKEGKEKLGGEPKPEEAKAEEKKETPKEEKK